MKEAVAEGDRVFPGDPGGAGDPRIARGRAERRRPTVARFRYEPDPRRWKALAVCLVVGFMTLLDVSIVNVALPSIESGLGANSADLSWVVSGYALAFGLVLVPAGRVGDARGRKVTFLIGLSLFVLASAACGFAQGPTQLVVFRLIQGVAGGILAPQVSGLIQLLFRGAERGRAFGMFAARVVYPQAPTIER